MSLIKIYNKCPLCSSTTNVVKEKYEMIGPEEFACKMVRCISCGHYFTHIPQKIDMEQFYSQGKYEVIDIKGSIFDQIISINNQIILYELSKLKVLNNTLLDFGAGKGNFMYSALSRGWNVKGIETAKKRAEYGIKEYGLNIETNEYKGGVIKGYPFNVITLFHVLEHIQNPKELLIELIDNNLSEDGYLVIEVPLFDSLQSMIAKGKWIHLDPPLHLSHFTHKSLFKLIDELNLTSAKCCYTSIHLGVLGMVQSIMSIFGYKGMIIEQLKFKKSLLLFFCISIVLPFAFLLEMISILIKRGGVIRVYCKRNKTK